MTWTTPEKHTKRRETLGNANQNKTTRGMKNTPKEAFRIKMPYEMLNKTKTLTIDRRRPKKKP